MIIQQKQTLLLAYQINYKRLLPFINLLADLCYLTKIQRNSAASQINVLKSYNAHQISQNCMNFSCSFQFSKVFTLKYYQLISYLFQTLFFVLLCNQRGQLEDKEGKYFTILLYFFSSMSEVIEDLEFTPPLRTPYYCIVNKLFLNCFINSTHIAHNENELTIVTTSPLLNCYELLTKIVVKNMELSLNSYLLKNGQYFVVGSAELRKNLYRAFLKSSFEQKMKMTINQEGRICLKMHTFMTKQVEFRHPKEAQSVRKFIHRIYVQMMEIFSVAFQKIKLSLQPTYQKVISQNPNSLQRLDIIKNTCRFTYVQPSFMKEDGKRGKMNHQNLPQFFVQQNELGMTNIYDLKLQSDQMDYIMKYNLFIKLWQQTHVLQKVEDTKLYKNFPLAKIKKMYQNNLKTPQIKTIPKIEAHQQILSQIVIQDIEKVQWSKLYEGGFGYVYKGLISFHFCRETNKEKKILHEKPIQKLVVLKTDKSDNQKATRIDLERVVLKSLKGCKSQYFPKFYETTQKIAKFKDFILSQFFPHRSLESWLQNYGIFTSIFSKLNFLLFICYGLNFLHQKHIIHRDLKLGNILINDKLSIKITDFGQSYHQNLEPVLSAKGRDSRPGFTFPYSPPQIYINNNRLWKETSYDIFSLGFIIFQILFARSLFDELKDTQLKKIYKKQSANIASHDPGIHGRYHSIIKERLYYASQELSYFGPQQILTPIINVVDRCLDPKSQNRPHLGWVIGIIKQIYFSLLDFYSF